MYATQTRPDDDDFLARRPARRMVVDVDRVRLQESQLPELYEIAYDEAKELIKAQVSGLS